MSGIVFQVVTKVQTCIFNTSDCTQVVDPKINITFLLFHLESFEEHIGEKHNLPLSTRYFLLFSPETEFSRFQLQKRILLEFNITPKLGK